MILCWTAAAVFSASFLAWIGLQLLGKLGRLSNSVAPLAELVGQVGKKLAEPVQYSPPKDNLSDDPAEHIMALRRLQTRRNKRAAEQQRRLVARLKQYQSGEKP